MHDDSFLFANAGYYSKLRCEYSTHTKKTKKLHLKKNIKFYVLTFITLGNTHGCIEKYLCVFIYCTQHHRDQIHQQLKQYQTTHIVYILCCLSN